MGELRLELTEYDSPMAWRWVLTGSEGDVLAEHRVSLDTDSWQRDAFFDLPRYVRLHAAPDRRTEDEARIIAEVGEWAGEQILGPVGPAVVAEHPAVVRVIVPDTATASLFIPLELAHVDGRPIASHDVTFVRQHASDHSDENREQADAPRDLRVLALFSLPAGGRPLGLRRERVELTRVFTELAGIGLSIELRVLQYGVTRARLAELLQDPRGWDIVHVSGHGAPGELLLEREDGTPDPVSGTELAQLLAAAQGRLKLVTVSACWSGAAVQRQLLGLPLPQDADRHPHETRSLATELTRLDCAVLAMRYPVLDEFAIALARRVYQSLLLGSEQPLPQVLGAALRTTLADAALPYPALSIATPVLFGARAADLRVRVAEQSGGQPRNTATLGANGFPAPPERFVGRTAVMARASAALASGSGVPGVVLSGMPGAGKTACARELAHTHAHAFDRLLWWEAPDEDDEIAGVLTQFALELETGFPGLRLLDALEDGTLLTTVLLELMHRCAQQRMLVVLDNVESLISADGRWRDTRWGQVIGAMCAHSGVGRLVLTTRRTPTELTGYLPTEVVNALTLDEALLLARELPHLDALIEGRLTAVGQQEAGKLARHVLEVAQGHPNLLVLADAQAADPQGLRRLLDAGDGAWRTAGGLPEGFFRTGESRAADEGYLHVLKTWARSVTATLTADERDLFFFLCCLDKDDRTASMTEATWPHVRDRLSRATTATDWQTALDTLSRCGLIVAPPPGAGLRQPYEIHPEIAAAGLAEAGREFRQAVDTHLGMYWSTLFLYTRQREGADGGDWLVTRSAVSATRYLRRQRAWMLAAQLLDDVLRRMPSRSVTAMVRSTLREIRAAVAGTEDEPAVTTILSRALELTDSASAEQLAREAFDGALARNDYARAHAAASDLCWHYLRMAKLPQALEFAERAIEHGRLAELDPWTRVGSEVDRLNVFQHMGKNELVLAEVVRLREHTETLYANGVPGEYAAPWMTRETLISTGANAARELNRWSEELALNAEVVASKRHRGVSDSELASTRFSDYFPLLRLGLEEESLHLLSWCQQIFQRNRDEMMLGSVFGALADVEGSRKRLDVAADLERKALRYKYRSYLQQNGFASDIAVSHHNLGGYLARAGESADALTHYFAAGLIRAFAGLDNLDDSIRGAVTVINSAAGAVPPELAELYRRANQVPGVRLDQLVDPGQADPVWNELRTTIFHASASADLAPTLAAWDPAIACLLVAAGGGEEAETASALFEAHVGAHENSWGSLVDVLREIHAGRRDRAMLHHLTRTPAAIAARALDAVTGRITIPRDLWMLIPMSSLIGTVVDVARGHSIRAAQVRLQVEAGLDHPEGGPLAAALLRILDGDRDPAIANGLEPSFSAAIATVLAHLQT